MSVFIGAIKKTYSTKNEVIAEIKRLLSLFEKTQFKIEALWRERDPIGSAAQTIGLRRAAARTYKRAFKLAQENGISDIEFIKLHHDVIGIPRL